MDAAFLPVAPLSLALAWAVTATAATVQGTIGFGFAIVSVPILSLVDPALAPVPQLLMAVPLTATMAFRERRHMDLSGVGWILVGRFPGAALGVLLLKLADGPALDGLLAFFVLLAVAIVATGVSIRRTRTTQLAAGIASGASAVVSSIGGPPIAILYKDAKGATIRSSLATIFLIGLVITIGARVLAGEISFRDLEVALYILPALFLGLFLSRYLHGKVEGPPLRRAILAVSALAAAGLMARVLA